MSESLKLGNLEHLILKYSLIDRSFWLKAYQYIKAKYFEKDENQQIFSLFKRHFEEYNELPDYEIAVNELRSIDQNTLRSIFTQIDPEDYEKYKDYIYQNTFDFIRENLITNSIKKSVDLLEEKKYEEIGEIIKEAVKFNFNTDLGLKLSDIEERYERIKELEKDRVPTGFPLLDALLNGGWGQKELYACAAPPGIGKCQSYDTEIEIEVDENSEIFETIKRCRSFREKRIKIGDLVEALGATNEKQEINVSDYNIKVNTPQGFKRINGVMKTEELPIINIKTQSTEMNCAFKHRVESKNGFDFVANVNEVRTKNGIEKCKVTDLARKENCYDIQVEDTHSYWSNDIHSHNSIFLANWGVGALKQGYNVLVYTLEISEERLSMRYDSILTKIPNSELVYDIDKLKKKYEMFAKTSKANLWIKEFPTKGASINDMKSHQEQLRLYENFNPDLILVDYAGLMRPSRKGADDYGELKTIYEDLRGWAVELSVPLVTAAQTNRKSLDEKGGTKEIITQAQVAESLGITQTLDLFMTITQSRNEKEEGIINLYLDKHRHGESSKILKYDIDYKTFLLEEVEI
jgi:replicative DNA helicase